MTVREMLALLAKHDPDKQVDVEVGGCLVPVIKDDISGECGTGVKLVLSRECKVCSVNDTDTE